MNIDFPVFPPSGISSQLQIAFQTIRDAFKGTLTQDTAAPRVILLSPNGTTYAVSITDAGVVTTAAISGKTREI